MSGILLATLGNSYGSKPANTSLPTISDTTPIVGQTISASDGTWTGTEPITFAYQWKNNGSNISGATSSSYTVQASDEGDTLSVQVTASNDIGSTSATSASTSAVGPARGADLYTAAGSYTWICPAGVTSISIVGVGGGGSSTSYGGGGGGALAYVNNAPVTPGNSYTLVVGASNTSFGASTFDSGGSNWIYASRGSNTGSSNGGGQGSGSFSLSASGGSSGGSSDGGQGGYAYPSVGAGGGGAAGYSGNGGKGGDSQYNSESSGASGSGGGGGGGGSAYRYNSYPADRLGGGGGGGVGVVGEGSSGAGGAAGDVTNKYGRGGDGGGSSSQDGNDGAFGTRPNGGNYGGGGGGLGDDTNQNAGLGGRGAVRIVWPGSTRQFPSTDVN